MENSNTFNGHQNTALPNSKIHISFIAFILIELITLLIGFGGGYFLFAKNNDPAPVVKEMKQISAQISPQVLEEAAISIPPEQQQLDVNTATIIPQSQGASLGDIKYTLPENWTGKITEESLFLSPKSGGGFLAIKVYDYSSSIGRREYYCQLRDVCVEGASSFVETKLGNISGYTAQGIDNSGGGSEYFGTKGNKFYIISSFNPPSPNDFENNYKAVLNSLIF